MKKYFTLILFSISLFSIKAQITTAEIRGTVLSQDKELLPGVVIIAIHEPTGTRYVASTFENGSYVLSNLKTGGPYNVVTSYISYLPEKRENIFLSLGETKKVEFTISQNATEISEVEISAKQNDPFDSKRRGTGTTIDKETIEKLPTLNRSLAEVSKLTPQSSGSSFGGANYRFNNLNIDGTGANDAFGFQEPASGAGGSTASGTPGSLAKTQPISLDAIEQLQINISPYDVKLGNFTGASINAVTRSGSNKTSGGLYFFDRNQYTTGRSVDASRSKIATYNDFQGGVRLGGALKKDKLFYFLNFENTNRNESVQYKPGSDGSAFNYQEMKDLKDTIQKRYGFDAGTIDDIALKTKSYKLFTRFDWNINDKNQFLIRFNYVDGSSENLERAPTILNFGSQGFTHISKSFNVVSELKSRISNNVSNNLILGYGNVQDKRDPFGDNILPHIEITYNTSNIIFLGTYRESAIFQMKQKNFEITDNLVYYKNKNTFTLGTHTEVFNFDYHFVTPFSGRWAYSSIANFYANKPSRIRGTYNLSDDSYDANYNNPSANFQVILPSLYVQHDYAASSRLRFTYGVRLEGNLFPESPNLILNFQNTSQFANVQSGINNQMILSPRIGFNYDLTGKEKIKVRGGSGVFLGRMPFAWMAYAYVYNGNQFGNIDVRPTTTVNLITDNYSQMAALQPGLKEINIVDKDFKLPRVLKSNLAFDFKLPKDIVFTIEGLYSKTIYDVLFKTINLKDSTVELQGGGDNRNIYASTGASGKYNAGYTNVFMLTNTNKGYRYSISASLSKEFTKGLSIYTAYNYGVSKDVMNGVRVSPQANWEWNQTLDPNNPQLSYSNFDIRHKSISSVSYTKKWKKVLEKSIINLVFNAQSGSPFTYIYSGDLNRDGSPNNDLLYVPNSQSDINLVDIKDGAGNVIVSANEQWNQLETYINNDHYLSSKKGQYTERNGGRTPWNNQLDLRLMNEFKVGKSGQNLQLLIDVINFTNLINRNLGHQFFVPNTTNAGYSLIRVNSINGAGVATYQFNNPTSKPWQTDAIASRWQMQIGLRFNF